MAKKKPKPVEDAPVEAEVSETVEVEAVEAVPETVETVEAVSEPIPLPPRPAPVGSDIGQSVTGDELGAVVGDAARHKGNTVIVVRSGYDVPEAQKLIQECGTTHRIGVKVNSKIAVRALWRSL